MNDIDFDLDQYKGMHIIEVLQAEGAYEQQAQDLGSSMATLSAMHMARWGSPLDWTVTKDSYDNGFSFTAYARDNLCEISLTV